VWQMKHCEVLEASDGQWFAFISENTAMCSASARRNAAEVVGPFSSLSQAVAACAGNVLSVPTDVNVLPNPEGSDNDDAIAAARARIRPPAWTSAMQAGTKGVR